MQITVKGHQFEVPERFRPGHICSPAEAMVLNRVVCDRARKAFLREHPEPLNRSQGGLAYELAELVRHYSLNGRAGDPIEDEAWEIANKVVRKELKAQGHLIGAMEESQITGYVEAKLEGPQGEIIRAQAAKRVARMQEAAQEALKVLEDME